MTAMKTGGSLWPARTKVSEKAPDWTGDVEIPADVLADLNKVAAAGGTARIAIIGYINTSTKDVGWLRLYSRIYKEYVGKNQRKEHDPTQRPDDEIPF